MQRLQQLLSSLNPGAGAGPAPDAPLPDTAEKVQISSLSLLKMLKHGRAGVPMEVMGLMLGAFVDEYTITCVDVFAMPQHGTGVSVEAVDPVFQQIMLDMLRQTGRPEMVVGWYHSHPGFGCWLSGVDMNTQQVPGPLPAHHRLAAPPLHACSHVEQSFEQLNQRAVAVVVDPVQSVKGKVVIDAFRLISPTGGQMLALPQEPRQTTSVVGHLKRPTIQARIHGLDRHYYSLVIDWRKNELEEQMLMNLNKDRWSKGLTARRFEDHQKSNEEVVKKMAALARDYHERVLAEEGKTLEEIEVQNVGKVDPKRHLEQDVADSMQQNVLQSLTSMLAIVTF